jgi:hypothetical protein
VLWDEPHAAVDRAVSTQSGIAQILATVAIELPSEVMRRLCREKSMRVKGMSAIVSVCAGQGQLKLGIKT